MKRDCPAFPRATPADQLGASLLRLLVRPTVCALSLAVGLALSSALALAAGPFTIEIGHSGGGALVPDGPSISVAAGSNVTVEIRPADCYGVSGVTVDGASVSARVRYTWTNVQANHSIYVDFVRGYFQVTASSGTGGIIAPVGVIDVACGDSVEFRMLPDCVARPTLTLDGVPVSEAKSYTLRDVRQDHVVHASFLTTAPTLALTAAPSPGRCEVPETLTVRLDAGIGGDVRIFDAGRLIRAVAIVDSVALVLESGLAPGVHQLRAEYTGTACEVRASVGVALTIDGEAQDTVRLGLTVVPDASRGGVPLLATVTPTVRGAPLTTRLDEIEFALDGESQLPSSTTPGSASVSLYPRTPGVHVVSARYPGAGCALSAAAESTTLVVAPVSATLSTPPLTFTPRLNHPVYLPAWIEAGGKAATTAGGQIVWKEAGVTLAVTPVVSGYAQAAVTFADSGQHSLQLHYEGDGLYSAADQSMIQRVIRDLVLPTLSSVTSPSRSRTVSLTARLDASATGSIGILEDGVFVQSYALAGGEAVFDHHTPTWGSHLIRAEYSGDARHEPSSVELRQGFWGSGFAVISLRCTPNPVAADSSVTATARMNPADAQGAIEFSNDGVTLGRVPLVGGLAEFTFALGRPGTHRIRVQFPGDSLYSPAAIESVETVNLRPVTLSLTSNAVSPVIGTPIEVTARVGPSDASGDVLFEWGQYQRTGYPYTARVPLSAGSAKTTVQADRAGTLSVYATYLGDATYALAWDQLPIPIRYVGPTTLTLTSSPTPAAVGDTATLTAVIYPSEASGNVHFYLDGRLAGNVALAHGVAAIRFPLTRAGSVICYALFDGDSTVGGSSAWFTLIVSNTLETSTSATLRRVPDGGQHAEITVTVTPRPDSGAVILMVDLMATDTVSVVNGVARFTYDSGDTGYHEFDAFYGGDSRHLPSSSRWFFSFQRLDTWILQALSGNPAGGKRVTVEASVGSPGGSGLLSGLLEVLVDNVPWASLALENNRTRFTYISNDYGTHDFLLRYSGDRLNLPSSVSWVQSFARAPAQLALVPSTTICHQGGELTLTATLSPVDIHGSVEFFVQGASVGRVTLQDGRAAITVRLNNPGSHAVEARFDGDTLISPAAALTIVDVLNDQTNTTLTVFSPIVAEGSYARLGAVVGPAGVRGQVEFIQDGASLGRGGLVDGNAGFDLLATGIGRHVITAQYLSTASYYKSTSASQSIRVVASPHIVATFVAGSGVHLRWGALDPSVITEVDLERSPAVTGPWSSLGAAPRSEDGGFVVNDTTATAGSTSWYRLRVKDIDGVVAGLYATSAYVPKRSFSLAPVTPNPARAAVSIEFDVPQEIAVRVVILDIQGREVARLAEGPQSLGHHAILWDGRTKNGVAPSGMYSVRCSLPGVQAERRFVLLR